jgi:hypothetical protein
MERSMKMLESLNLADLRELSHRRDLDADEWAVILMEWRRRELRARAPIMMMLERWFQASKDKSYERFREMHRLFRPWVGQEAEAESCWQWWTEDERARPAPVANRRLPASEPAWRIIARPSERSGRNTRGLRDESAMHRCGYLVGDTHGLSLAARHGLLDRFFSEPLPALIKAEFGDDYGAPWSEKRLRKMATVMEYNIERFRRHDPARFAAAVEAWEADLEYLRARYHDGWCPFPWPRVAVAEVRDMAEMALV